MQNIKIILLSLLLLIGLGLNAQSKNPKYVFLFIGDGMGVNQVYITELFKGVAEKKKGGEPLLFSTFPINSFMTTYSANSFITCSSAAGTAMATGHKTNNGVLGKSPNLDSNYQNISIKAKNAGYKVGIVSSVSIDHATPASFYAHQNNRSNYYEISLEMPNYGIDYFGGGGFRLPQGKGKTEVDAYKNAESKGYTICKTKSDLQTIKKGDSKIFAINPKHYPQGDFLWEIDHTEGGISLAEFTAKGIEVLDNNKGFFMMIEGGKIDWACHSNDVVSMIYEVNAFEMAVAEAFEFYKKHPDETLIIVTADHETGSLSCGFSSDLNIGLLKYQKISEQEFKHKIEQLKKTNSKASFEDILQLISNDFGLGKQVFGLELSKNDSLELLQAYNSEFLLNEKTNPDSDYLQKSKTPSITNCAIKILNNKAGIGWGNTDHSAMPVPVRVIGVGAQYFQKSFDNTDLPKIIGQLMKLEK